MNSKIEEALNILQEECAEVVQAVSKCRRFGPNNHKPNKPKTNVECLEEEIGDLLAMVDILVDAGFINLDNLHKAKYNKIEKLKVWSNIFKD
jgi:NTP pyrophosphatase (non-canonical NTP hydrolase)